MMCLQPGQDLERLVDDIGHPLERTPARGRAGCARSSPARSAARRSWRRSCRRASSPSWRNARPVSSSRVGSPERSTRAASSIASATAPPAVPRGGTRRRARALVPRRIGRQDQRRDLPRRRARRRDRRGAVGRDRLRVGRGLDPMRVWPSPAVSMSEVKRRVVAGGDRSRGRRRC